MLDAVHDMVTRMRNAWPKLCANLPLTVEHRDSIAAHMESLPLFGARTVF